MTNPPLEEKNLTFFTLVKVIRQPAIWDISCRIMPGNKTIQYIVCLLASFTKTSSLKKTKRVKRTRTDRT
jgi:hypothetical protein